MWALFAAVVLSAPPLPAEISPPFSYIELAVTPPPTRGVPATDKVLLPVWEGCDAQAIWLMRALTGVARALEQLQQSLDRVPGVEKRLWSRKGTLAEVLRHLGEGRFQSKSSCAEPKLLDGYRLELTAAPKKWCEVEAKQDGAFWFFSSGQPSAVVQVSPGAETPCAPRLSAVLFDKKGVARVQFHADWAGRPSATLLGERCAHLDYTFQDAKQAWVPAWRSCRAAGVQGR
mgnify:CR=1 FL=1